MIIDKKTPNLDGYKIHSADGELILGVVRFDTKTCEADRMVLPDAKRVSVRTESGGEHFHMKGSKVVTERIKLDGAYATFRGQRV